MKKEKKSNKKKIIFIIIVLIIIIGVITAIIINKNNIKKEETEKVAEQETEEVAIQVTGKATEEKQTNDYKISNVKISAKDSQAEIALTIKNISNKSTIERDVYIKYLDSQNQEMGQTRIHLPKMEKGKELSITSIITKNLKEAADYKIEY